MPGPVEGANGRAVDGKSWEKVGDNTTRTRVEGGWLYKVENYLGNVAIEFVPDPPQTVDMSKFLTG